MHFKEIRITRAKDDHIIIIKYSIFQDAVIILNL